MSRHLSGLGILATVLILCTIPGWGQKVSTRPFKLTSADGGFSVTLPGGFPHPERKSETSEDEAGTTKTTTYTSGSDRGACLVSFTMYPQSLFDQATSEQLLDAARDGALEGSEEGLEQQEDFEFGAHLARSVYFTTTDDEGTALYSRFVWIVARPYLYQIGFVAYTREELAAEDIESYFDSFVLTPPKVKKKAKK